jgi:ribosome-binding ATPase YchF (GTP1/OBG family)
VQEALNQTAFKLLDLIVVYPVEDAHKWTSGKGHYLPDAHLIHRGATPHDLAVKIHSSFGERFVAAIDCRNGQRIGKEETLKDKQIVKIQLSH